MVYALAPISDRSCFDALQYGQYDLLKMAGVVVSTLAADHPLEGLVLLRNVPTAFSSMMLWTLVFAADMAAGFTVDPKNRRRNEMMGNW